MLQDDETLAGRSYQKDTTLVASVTEVLEHVTVRGRLLPGEVRINVQAVDTIDNVKAKIQETTRISTDQLSLQFGKVLLEDGPLEDGRLEFLLGDYNIPNGATLVLKAKAKGKGKAKAKSKRSAASPIVGDAAGSR